MKNACCVINLASTTTVDAMIFGTPVICINYNNDPALSRQWNRAEGWYESDHYIYLLSFGAILMCHSEQELQSMIVDCKRNDFPAEKMRLLVKEFVTEKDAIKTVVDFCTGAP